MLPTTPSAGTGKPPSQIPWDHDHHFIRISPPSPSFIILPYQAISSAGICPRKMETNYPRASRVISARLFDSFSEVAISQLLCSSDKLHSFLEFQQHFKVYSNLMSFHFVYKFVQSSKRRRVSLRTPVLREGWIVFPAKQTVGVSDESGFAFPDKLLHYALRFQAC